MPYDNQQKGAFENVHDNHQAYDEDIEKSSMGLCRPESGLHARQSEECVHAINLVRTMGACTGSSLEFYCLAILVLPLLFDFNMNQSSILWGFAQLPVFLRLISHAQRREPTVTTTRNAKSGRPFYGPNPWGRTNHDPKMSATGVNKRRERERVYCWNSIRP
jgi:hypothetical protein